MDIYEPPAGALALISGPCWRRGENSNSKALALGHEALSGGGARRQRVPVIIPLFGGTRSVLIRCKRAAKQFLVVPQIRIKKQVAHAAAAGWGYNEIMNYHGTRTRCEPGASCTRETLPGGRGRCSSAMWKRPTTLILAIQMSRCLPSLLQSHHFTLQGKSVCSECALTPP